MKKLIYLFVVTSIFLASCSNIPDDPYYFADWQEDKLKLEAELSKDDYMFIYSWVFFLTDEETIKNDTIEGKSYKELYKMFKEWKKKIESMEMEREKNSY